MSAINFNDNAGLFYAFMRKIAETHADIQHVDEKNKHFYRGELEEFFMGLRTKVKFPALVVEGFELNYSENQNTFKHRESAFTVIFSYANKDDYEAITDCFSRSEEIGDEIINYMKAYGKKLACQVRIKNVNALQIQNETEKYAGVRFSFSVEKLHKTSTTASKWLNQE
ncbi:MAG: hypothetical protein WC900_08270 [Oscillospiraceae bacterium]|jgi:hypothetical protein